MHKKFFILLALFFLFSSLLSADAATITWSGGGSDNLASNSANWSGNTVPQYGDDVIFDSTSSKDCTWDLTVTIASLTIASGYAGTVTLSSSADLTIAKDFDPPTVATNPATNINGNAATLNATVNPNGLETTVYFEWGTDIFYKNTTPAQNIGSGTDNISVSAFINRLSTNTTYHYRVVATNAADTSYGDDMSFTTTGGTNVSGTISTDTTWTYAGSPYIVTSHVYVISETTKPVLTIEPGVEVRFNTGVGLFIGGSPWYIKLYKGVLKAVGTSLSPIVFTSNQNNPAPGAWFGIYFYNNSTPGENIIENITIEYGGVSTSYPYEIYVKNSAITINNSIIRYSKYSGIYTEGNSLIVVTDSIISNNNTNGVYHNSTSSLTVTGSTISNNGTYGIFLGGSAKGDINITFSNIMGNASYGIYYQSSPFLKVEQCNITGNAQGIYTPSAQPGEARYNWWGSNTGPSGQGPGTGQSISTGISFEPWLGTTYTYPFYNADLSATLQEFNPLNNSVNYTFSISENSNWTFSIKDSIGTAVKAFTGSGTSGTVIWDGRDDSDVIVPDGTYTYQLSSTSLSDSSSSAPFVGNVVVGTGLPKAEITFPVNNQFINNNLLDIQGTATDSDFKNYKVEYGLGPAPAVWTLIKSSTTPVDAGTLASWNPSNLTGRSYTIRLSVTDTTGKTATASVEVKLLNIYSITVSNPTFSPNGDGYKDTTSISASITYPSDWTLDIRNSVGVLVKSFSGSGTSVSVTWDGKDTSGNIQPEGTYTYTITATEINSGVIATTTGNITIDLPPPTATTNPASDITADSATLNASVNPNNSITYARFEWGTDISYGKSTYQQSLGNGTSPVNIVATLTGLLPTTTYHYRVVATNANGTTYGSDMSFTTGAGSYPPPNTTTDPATNMQGNSATLNATVNPNGLSTTVYFEWGISDTNYDYSTPIQSIGSGANDINVSANISALTPKTTYHYRVVATNGSGTSYGLDRSFTTTSETHLLPIATTDSATNIGSFSTTLNATVNSNSPSNTTAYFEWGKDTSYGNTTPIQSVGSGIRNISVSNNLPGLTGGTTYHYRVVATNANGTTYGNDMSFTTNIAPYVSDITTNSAKITWTTDLPLNSYVEYGSAVSPTSSVSDSTLTTTHSITLNNLTSATFYYFKVKSENTEGFSSSSEVNTFTTLSPPSSISLTITSPLIGDTVYNQDVMVKGTVTNFPPMETGVTVNGISAIVYGNDFFANHVPLKEGENTITAIATDAAGDKATESIIVYAVTTPHVNLRANIESGIGLLTTYFSVSTEIPNAVSTYQMDYEGDGNVDYTDSTFDNISVTYSTEGIYYPTVIVTDSQGITYSDTIAIVVLNASQLDALLRAKWEAMKNALQVKDIEKALSYFDEKSRDRYRAIFEALKDQMPSILDTFIEFNLIKSHESIIEYEIVANESGVLYSYPVTFIKSEDGIWRFKDF